MKRIILLFSSLFIITFIFISCQKEEAIVDNPKDPMAKSNASCEGCHTNFELLKAIQKPDTATGGGGCGGDAPHYEPCERVYLGGQGYKDFKNSIHGKLSCTNCHNGVDNTGDKNLAHSKDFIAHPSKRADIKCANCHPDIYAKTKNSIHEQGWGQKNMVTLRYGMPNGYKDFDKLPDLLKTGYNDNCGKCHATCGECHIVRPKAGGGGLANGHKFTKTPDMVNVCVTCHTSRGGHAYLGIAPGTVPDIHKTKMNFTCLSCHTKDEIHGDGIIYDQRYKVKDLPKCTNCHPGLENKNTYHTIHYKTFECYACHSQDYNNCASCHVGGAGARIAAYQGFKIGLNPIPETRNYKLALLRRSLSAPDSWSLYGVPTLSNYNVAPNYKYTTPHNIQKWTTRTKVADGKPCFDACHIIKEGNTYRNKLLYLFESDLLDWEKASTKHLTVDGKLPASWGVQ